MGTSIYADATHDPRKRLVEMYHSRIHDLNKEEILKATGDKEGSICVLIATIAYGMGIDCKDVTTVILYGLSYNVETYLQERGRAGRSSQNQCKSVILYSNNMTKHCHETRVDYVKEKSKCRRKMLLEKFDVDTSKLPSHEYPHQCCDVCQKDCKCDDHTCSSEFFESEGPEMVDTEVAARTVTEEQIFCTLTKTGLSQESFKSAIFKISKK